MCVLAKSLGKQTALLCPKIERDVVAGLKLCKLRKKIASADALPLENAASGAQTKKCGLTRVNVDRGEQPPPLMLLLFLNLQLICLCVCVCVLMASLIYLQCIFIAAAASSTAGTSSLSEPPASLTGRLFLVAKGI